MSKPAIIPQRIAVADRDADPYYERTRSASHSPVRSPASEISDWSDITAPDSGYTKWRHTLGILLILITVFLWTASNFLASTIFADNTYSKPYFVTYINTTFFIFPILPMLGKYLYDERGERKDWNTFLNRRVGKFTLLTREEQGDSTLKRPRDHNPSSSASARLLLAEDVAESQDLAHSWHSVLPDALTVYDTARLSVEFCIPWFAANYFAAACLEYTTVASATILSSTSSIWTLLLGSLVGAEVFTVRKLIGVLASLAGVAVISLVDISGNSDQNRGSFPHKSRGEVLVGDSMALVSAVLYGVYSILMKKRIGDEDRVNMPLFFGFIGIFNIIALWPGFPILHWTRIETFELPPSSRVTSIILVNSASSLLADMCWAFAVLLTSPLVVTVGLSLTIPLSLIGQMVLDAQYASWLYWVGACIVVLSFVFINREEKRVEEVLAQELAASRASMAASRASIGTPRREEYRRSNEEDGLLFSGDEDEREADGRGKGKDARGKD